MGGRKLNISIIFISHSCFEVPKPRRLNVTNSFIMKIPNKRDIQEIASNHSADIEIYKRSMKIYKGYTEQPFSFLVTDMNLTSDNPVRFRKSLL